MAIGVGGGWEHRVSKWDGREADDGGRVAEVHGGVVGREGVARGIHNRV